MDAGDGINPDEAGNNRRKGGRLRCDFLKSNVGPVLDVSSKGARIRLVSKKQPQVGKTITLFLQAGDLTEPVLGTIVRATRVSRGLYEVGVEFELADEQQGRRLAALAQVANSRFSMRHLRDAA